MKTFNVLNRNDKKSQEIAIIISNELVDKGLKKDSVKPNIVVCVGGDGTILAAINQYLKIIDDVVFCGVHTGTLGFYTDFKANEIKQLVDGIILDDYDVKKYNMVEIKIVADGREDNYYALNEGRIENNQHTQVMEIYIDDQHFETIRGNGLNFSTPTGSTGYNKSLGGAVMNPLTKAIQMCEIASINNLAYRSLGSPLIIDQTQTIRIELNEIGETILGYDSFSLDLKKNYQNIDHIAFSLADKYVCFGYFKEFSFMDRVKRNFIQREE